jgi:tripartite-type tricarboxylate transporter receptor subunit TctC
MALRRRTLLWASAAASFSGGPALAQQYPARPVRVILPSASGSTIDVNGRYIADQLAKRLRASVVVDNRAGVGGGIGSDLVSKAAPDGYTILFGGITHFTTRLLPDSALRYDPVKEFAGLAKVSSASLALVVPVDSPYRTAKDLVDAMKAKPGEIPYGSGGPGSTSHLCMVMFSDLTQSRAKHIAYKGNNQAITDTVGGQVALTWQGATGVLPLIKAGRLRPLAVSGRVRWESLPDVPTAHEVGAQGMDIVSWMGLFGPAGLPASTIQLLSDETVQIARSPEYKEFADKQGMEVDVMDHRTFQASMPAELEKWKRVISLAHAR